MKRYCKNKDITDIKVITQCIYDCFVGKWYRAETAQLIAQQGLLSYKAAKYLGRKGDKEELKASIDRLAQSIQVNIINRTVSFPPIITRKMQDANSGKLRKIGREKMLQQIYDYIAVYGIEELCRKKLGYSQCACMPGRGQIYGKRIIEKWLKHDLSGTKYCIKCDIQKCYPSINHDILLKFLRRDIKNNNLIWLLETLIKTHGTGLSIGSYLSQYLCNYLLSYAYHYATEQLAITKTRRGQTKRVRLVNHVLFYMDDIMFLGGNKRHLKQAFEMFREYARSVLGLTIKPNWRLFRVQYKDHNGRIHGGIIDIMGFKIGRYNTTLRRRIFIRARRKILKIRKAIRKRQKIPLKLAAGAVALYGWFKHCNCYKFRRKYNSIIKIARKVISRAAKTKREGLIKC